MKTQLIYIDKDLTFTFIKENEEYIQILNNIIKEIILLKGYCTLNNLIKTIHDLSDELEEYCITNKDKFKINSMKDKGLVGKIVEFYLFGNLPNNNSNPDMIYGDIKTTHFKKIGCLKDNYIYNAKERLTLTNFGDPNKQLNIDSIINKNSLEETKFYSKINKGIVLVFQYENFDYENINQIYQKKIIAIVNYNLNDLFIKHTEIKNTFQHDFEKIKNCIINKNVSQSGQTYLHIHKHGCKNGLTRAFGFTNKFLTKLVAITLQVPLIKKGKSSYIHFI